MKLFNIVWNVEVDEKARATREVFIKELYIAYRSSTIKPEKIILSEDCGFYKDVAIKYPELPVSSS